MIILVDNRDYAIELCKDSDTYHFAEGIAVNFGLFLSDNGHNIVFNGKKMEDYLDKNNIYYIHIEDKYKTFKTFQRALNKAIEDNKDLINANLINFKSLYAVREDGTKGTVLSDNLLELYYDKELKKYKIYLDFESITDEDVYERLKEEYNKLIEWYKKEYNEKLEEFKPYKVIEVVKILNDYDYDEGAYYLSANSIQKVIYKLKTLIEAYSPFTQAGNTIY